MVGFIPILTAQKRTAIWNLILSMPQNGPTTNIPVYANSETPMVGSNPYLDVASIRNWWLVTGI